MLIETITADGNAWLVCGPDGPKEVERALPLLGREDNAVLAHRAATADERAQWIARYNFHLKHGGDADKLFAISLMNRSNSKPYEPVPHQVYRGSVAAFIEHASQLHPGDLFFTTEGHLWEVDRTDPSIGDWLAGPAEQQIR